MSRLLETELKKSDPIRGSLCATELEYLNYWSTRKGIRTVTNQRRLLPELKTPTMKGRVEESTITEIYGTRRAYILVSPRAPTLAKVPWKKV